jgi:hypothetical protein
MDIELNVDSNNALANKLKTVTTSEIYNNIKSTQSLEIFKIATSFIISAWLVKLLDDIIFDYYKKHIFLYFILLIVFLIAIIIISTNAFTYVKIINDKDDFLKKITYEG